MSAESSVSKPGAAHPPKEQHQLAGLDPRERGFNRPVEFEYVEGGCRARLRYEAFRIAATPVPTSDEALRSLVGLLHEQGYRQLRTQWSFREGQYLGNREPWIEYPDPMPVPQSWWARLTRWLTRGDHAVSGDPQP
ncbi:hypothetical protein YTPLAS18_23300 [Nitrospira sp.]|nr:hypothetical protein YTPLAS18_23300 [Nitrospira sp.]